MIHKTWVRITSKTSSLLTLGVKYGANHQISKYEFSLNHIKGCLLNYISLFRKSISLMI